MKKQKTSPVIVDISREKLFLCSRSNPQLLTFNFTNEMVADLEVIDKEGLRTRLNNFISENKIKPAPLIIILESSVYFEKDYAGTEPNAEEVQKFIDTVPFAGISSKVFKYGNGYKQVVINRELYQSLQQVFERLHFPLLSVVPGFVLPMINAPKDFSTESCRVIYRKMDEVLANSFSSANPDEGSFSEKREAWLEKHKVVVVALSLLMVGICIGVAYWTLMKPKPKPSRTVVSVPKAVVTEVPPTPTPEEKVSPEQLVGLTTEVLNGSGVSGLAASWEAKLRDWGFEKVQTGNSAVRSGVKVTYSLNVPEVFKKQLEAELVKEGETVEATTSADSEFDLILVIGK